MVDVKIAPTIKTKEIPIPKNEVSNFNEASFLKKISSFHEKNAIGNERKKHKIKYIIFGSSKLDILKKA